MADGLDVLSLLRATWSADSPLDLWGRAVMTVLIRHADAEGVCYPGTALIAREAAISRAKVFECLTALEQQRLIVREQRARGAGFDANLYRLAPAPTSPPGGLRAASKTPPGGVREADGSPQRGPSAATTSPPGGLEVVHSVDSGSPQRGHELPKNYSSTTQRVAAPTKRRRGNLWHFVPTDWQPKDHHRALARELGVSLEKELQSYREHEFKAAKSDADLAFARWLRNAKDFQTRRSPSAPSVQRGIATGKETGSFDDCEAHP